MSRKEEWDRVYREVPLEEIPWQTEEPPKQLVELIKKKKISVGVVLDICCGAGTHSAFLASKGFKVVGIDISPKAILFAKKKCKKCVFVVGDSVRLPSKKNVFSFVFDRGCFHHMPDREKPEFVQGLDRILEERGAYHLNCFSDKDKAFGRGLSREDIVNYFSEKFEIESIEDVTFRETGSGFVRYFYTVFMKKIL